MIFLQSKLKAQMLQWIKLFEEWSDY